MKDVFIYGIEAKKKGGYKEHDFITSLFLIIIAINQPNK